MQQSTKFKDTEIGKIPEEWDLKEFRELADVKGGKRLPIGEKFSDTKTPYPYIRVSDLRNGTIDTSNLQFLKENTHSKIKNYTIGHDDVYISIAGTIGLAGLIPRELDGANLTENAAKITNLRNLKKEFLAYLLNSSIIQRQIQSHIGQVSQPKLALFRIEKLRVPCPMINEQQEIASILSKVDDLIHKKDQIIEQTQRLRKGLMQRLLTKGIGHTKFKKTKFGEIPEDWEIARLQNICNKIIDGTHFTPRYTKEGIPFLRITDIQQEHIDWENVKRISLEEHSILTKRCKPEKGDVLLSKNGTVGITKIVDWDMPFSIFVSLCLIKPIHTKIKNYYLKYILPSDICFKQIKIRSKQGTVTNLHLEEIRELLIPLPSIEEQQKISSIILEMTKLIQHQKINRHLCENLKAGLLQELLTGKIRVKV